MRRFVIGLFAVIVVMILFVVLCTFVKRPYEEVLLVRFGSLVDKSRHVKLAYNWYFKFPTDTVVPIDQRLHLYTGPLQQVATAGREPISVRTFAAWRIVEPVKFYQTTGGSDQKARDIIDQKMRGLVGGKLAAYTLDQFFNVDETQVETGRVELAIATEATNGSGGTDPRERQTGLKEQGIEVVEVGFSRMAFPPSNAEAVYQAMVARLNTEARRYEAEGEAMVSKLNADGEKEASEIVAKATAEAGVIRGEGEARAIQLISEMQRGEGSQEFYQFWKSLDFVKNAVNRNTILILTTDSPLLRSLYQSEPPGQGGAGRRAPATRPAGAAAASSERRAEQASEAGR